MRRESGIPSRGTDPLSLYDPVARKLFADNQSVPAAIVNSLTENLRYTTHAKSFDQET